MKPKSINNPYHNPFHNRFHVPVHSRLDEMQALTQMTWLNQRTTDEKSDSRESAHKTHLVKTTVFGFLCFFAAYALFRIFVT
jgi:hypothetical protein